MVTLQRGKNLIDTITEDHRAVEAVFAELDTGVGDTQRRHEMVEHVIAELVRHSVGEEQFVYPVIRRALGDEDADHELREHEQAERIMKQLDGLSPTDADYEVLVRKLIDSIRHHIDEEENDVLPNLVQVCDTEELDRIAEDFRRAKQNAPTRPHPAAPDTPPANRILDPGAGLVDRLRDAMAGCSG